MSNTSTPSSRKLGSAESFMSRAFTAYLSFYFQQRTSAVPFILIRLLEPVQTFTFEPMISHLAQDANEGSVFSKNVCFVCFGKGVSR